jgi:hypothetical protein
MWPVEIDHDNMNIRTLRDMLTKAVSLTTLHLFLGVINSSYSHVFAVTIPTLRYLKVDGHSRVQGAVMETLLSLISAPNLECLAFYNLTSSDVDSISSYLTSSSGPKFPVLRTLQFDTSKFDPITEGLIRSLPTITRLDLVRSPFANALHFLAATAFLPRLDTLQLELDAITPPFYEMLRCRIHIGHPVKKLRLLVGKLGAPDLCIDNMTIELLDRYTYRAENNPMAYFD